MLEVLGGSGREWEWEGHLEGILLRYLSLSLWRYFDTANNGVTVKRLTLRYVDVE